MRMRQNLVALCSGMLFAWGLTLSGMTQPSKVIGFLNITGHWDPSLIFVMVGAIALHGLVYQLWLKKRSRPLFGDRFYWPELKSIDPRLLLGAGIFGIGWGLAGFCPGPALVSLVSLHRSALIFVAAMLGGMLLFQVYTAVSKKAKVP